MFGKHGGQLFSRMPYSMFHTDRPSSVNYNFLSAEEDLLAQLGACLRLMSDDMGDNTQVNESLIADKEKENHRTLKRNNETRAVYRQPCLSLSRQLLGGVSSVQFSSV
jgi:hypothetical protein